MDLQRADVREHWDRMAPLVTACLAGHPERPEDIYAGLLYQKACLYVCEDGFVVLWPQPLVPGQHQRVEVTCAARWGAPGLLERGLQEVEQLARDAGAGVLTCRTAGDSRPPWLDARWIAAHTEYQLEL